MDGMLAATKADDSWSSFQAIGGGMGMQLAPA